MNSQKTNEYLPSEEEVATFFQNHQGWHPVLRITELLINGKVNHTTPLDREWGCVRKTLHKLKSEGILIVENEGRNIHEEKFSSTPDRIERYFEPKPDKKNEEEIFKLEPEFYGIGMKLRPLLRKFLVILSKIKHDKD